MATTPQPHRVYHGKDVEMLTAISSIMDAAVEYKTALQAERSTWADPFFSDLKDDIDTVIQTYMGVDGAKELRLATQAVLGIQANAIEDLVAFKTQLERDYRTDQPTLSEDLNELGFTAYFKDAYHKDQEALVQLLLQFKTNMTPALQTTLVAKGQSATRITRITGYADTLKNANISQETFKSSRKPATEEAINAFNGVYSRVMDIAVIAANLFKNDLPKQSRFHYSKVLKAENTFH